MRARTMAGTVVVNGKLVTCLYFLRVEVRAVPRVK